MVTNVLLTNAIDKILIQLIIDRCMKSLMIFVINILILIVYEKII